MEVFWMNANWSTALAMSDQRNTSRTDDHLQPLFSQYPDELLHFAVGACVLFTLLGVPGNFITIVALLRYTKVSFPFLPLSIHSTCHWLGFLGRPAGQTVTERISSGCKTFDNELFATGTFWAFQRCKERAR